MMGAFLAISRAIDALNERFGRIADWCVLLAVLISAGNALVRYGFSFSSNAWLEIQWYMFAAMFMLGAPYTLKRNEHVRVDIIYGNLSKRLQLWIDLLGTIFFLMPPVLIIGWMSWPLFYESFAQRRGLGQCRRAAALAGEAAAAARLRPAGAPGHLGDHQADRGTPGLPGHGRGIREAAAVISFNMMAPLMFGGLVVFLLIGYPVAFSLAAVGLFFAAIAIEHGYFTMALLQALPERVFGIMSNDLLLAIPFFTFMGAILERCGLAEDLLEGAGQLFGPVRGGLAYAVILVGAMLGAITGTVAASVIAMGLISLPIMMRYGYDLRLATGVIAASGTITQLIPPSLVLIVLADQLGRSVGDMYAGAIGPSIIQVLLFCAYVFVLSIFRPSRRAGPAAGGPHPRGWALAAQMPLGHGAVAGPDLPGAGHHPARPRHADRGRRHGRGGRHGAGGGQPAAHLAAAGQAWPRPCGSPPWWSSS